MRPLRDPHAPARRRAGTPAGRRPRAPLGRERAPAGPVRSGRAPGGGPRDAPGTLPPEHPDRGSAVAEYVLVAGLLALLFTGTLQLALALHVRNTLIDAAAAGARYGTLADRTPEDGVARTREIIAGHLGPAYAQDVTAAPAEAGGVRTLRVEVVAPLPVVALLGPPEAVTVHGHAVLAG